MTKTTDELKKEYLDIVERIEFHYLGYKPDEPDQCFKVYRDTHDAILELMHLQNPYRTPITVQELEGMKREITAFSMHPEDIKNREYNAALQAVIERISDDQNNG